MGFSRFMFGVTLRLILLMSSLLVLVYLFLFPDYPAATLLVGTVIVILTINIYDFVSKTNHELARFLDAVRYADFGQRFSFTNVGAGFSELGETFTHILDRFREDRKQQESELRYLKALLEHVPVPLITLHGDGKISLWNNASRRLFGVAKINTTKDLIVFGENFYQELESILPGEKRLVEFTFDGMSQGLSITASEIVIAAQAEKLVSLQNIQSELDGMQLSAWQDLVKVLTHEIMNSITPVSSLAKTAAELVDDASNKVIDHPELVAELKDAKEAVMTVARRSDGLMSFVNSYRQFSDFNAPNKKPFEVETLFTDITALVTADWASAENSDLEIELSISVKPPSLKVHADRQMIEQLLINLLQNSEHALRGLKVQKIHLSGGINKYGHVMLEVSDTGIGITDEVADKIFVPFYTTRKNGSGVGLALSRQIMSAHGGSIAFSNQATSGAKFTLIF